MKGLDEDVEIRDREIGQKILKLRQLGVLALDTSILAFSAKEVSRLEVSGLTEKVMRMSELLEQIELEVPQDVEEAKGAEVDKVMI